MSALLWIVSVALIADLARAFVKPYKTHRFCNGRGLDPRCNYTGKVLRFGARWVRPNLRRK
jgi:hypothetical protein